MELVLTRAQALAAGWSADAVDALVRAGRWRSLRRAVYLTQPELPHDDAVRHALLVAAACLATAADVVGSGTSAAAVHGLPLLSGPGDRPMLTRVRPSATGSRVAARIAGVPPAHRCVVHGAPVTTLVRTAVDLARTAGDLDAVVVLDAALARVPVARLDEVLAVQRGWPGSALARRRIDRADGRAESPLESVARLQMARQGLPQPELQVLVGGLDGPVGRVDFLWRARRTVGEADGRLKYAAAEDLWAEKRREDALRDAGFEVVRFGWTEVMHRPHVLRERVLRAFARAELRAA